MPLAKVRQLAYEQGYIFGNPKKDSSIDLWVNYELLKAGPDLVSVSFCDATLTAVTLTRYSSLHEITSMIKDWQAEYGEPKVLPESRYFQGTQLSTIDFQWFGRDNIKRTITITQHHEERTAVALGYAYIKHPCWSDPKNSAGK
jgi:hypothetical protein